MPRFNVAQMVRNKADEKKNTKKYVQQFIKNV